MTAETIFDIGIGKDPACVLAGEKEVTRARDDRTGTSTTCAVYLAGARLRKSRLTLDPLPCNRRYVVIKGLMSDVIVFSTSSRVPRDVLNFTSFFGDTVEKKLRRAKCGCVLFFKQSFYVCKYRHGIIKINRLYKHCTVKSFFR